MKELIDQLQTERKLSHQQWVKLIANYTTDDAAYAAQLARDISLRVFGRDIYFRGIVEFTSYCKNNCLYCGLRRGNSEITRYRLDEDTILACCKDGYALGYRTFVLQGGEDPYFNDDRLSAIVTQIKTEFPDTAITLSVGERSLESYQRLFDAGADRYLLRHETASKELYNQLHPSEMSFEHRMNCLKQLKEIGYQTGCGMMVGSPGQTAEHLALDMEFIENFHPHMVGMGPFLPHHQTPFATQPAGSIQTTLFLMSLCRIMIPNLLLPATTALDSGENHGRMQAILAGANVVMPNLSPKEVRKGYLLYDGKPGLSQDAAESLNDLKKQVETIGYRIICGRGDYQEMRDKL